jgi:hypothetical protein
VIVLRRGSSSKKESPEKPEKVEKPVSDKKAAKAKAADEKAAKKIAAKAKAADDKAAKKAGKKPRIKEPPAVGADMPRGVLVRRPKTSIYSVMLGISAAALAIGCLMLVLEIWTYGAPWTFPWNIPINLR